MEQFAASLYRPIILLLVLVVAITVHEFSHAWAAYKLGDPTAKSQGRVSLNPLKHLDPIGTLMIFIVKIGWGKPVPVNPQNFKNPIRDNALVSFAGPFSNLLTAVVVSLPLKFFATGSDAFSLFMTDFLSLLIFISVLLFLFNLIPFKPLDGSAILAYFIPRKHFYAFEAFMRKHMNHFLLFVLIDLFIFPRYLGFSIISTIIFVPATFIIQFIMAGV